MLKIFYIMSIVKKALPEKLLVETQDLKLKMYSNPDLMCQAGTEEENEEHFYLKETEKIQQQLMKDLSIETSNHKTLLERLDANIDSIHRALYNKNIYPDGISVPLTISRVIQSTKIVKKKMSPSSCSTF